MKVLKHMAIIVITTMAGAFLASVFGLPLLGVVIGAAESEPLWEVAFAMLILTPFASVLMVPVALGAAISLSTAKAFIDPYHAGIIGLSTGAVWGCAGGFFLYWFFQGEVGVVAALIIGIVAGVTSGLASAALHSRLWRWLL